MTGSDFWISQWCIPTRIAGLSSTADDDAPTAGRPSGLNGRVLFLLDTGLHGYIMVYIRSWRDKASSWFQWVGVALESEGFSGFTVFEALQQQQKVWIG